MSQFAKLTSEQLKEMIEKEMESRRGAREALDQLENGEEVLDAEHRSSVLSTDLNTTNNEFDYQCLDGAVRLLNTHLIYQSNADQVPGTIYIIQGQAGINIVVPQDWA